MKVSASAIEKGRWWMNTIVEFIRADGADKINKFRLSIFIAHLD